MRVKPITITPGTNDQTVEEKLEVIVLKINEIVAVINENS